MKRPDELTRLLSYVRPYKGRLAWAVVLLALVGLAEGLTALMITPAFDRVLNPATTDPTLPLVRLPFGGRTIYLNAFFPHNQNHQRNRKDRPDIVDMVGEKGI